jgi:lipoprotein-anchoring transpeptidase ErfK/SrfK
VEAGARSVATATRPLVDVFADPTSAHAAQTLAHPTPSGAPLTFLVEAEWNGWLRVMLPGPPAGSRGWVAADQVELNEVDGNITIDLDQRRLVYERNGQAEVQIPVSVGYMDAPATGPTYVTEVLALSSRSETYGSHVLVLGGAANGPDQLYRGKDLVAVHGISDDALVGRQLPSGSVAVTSMDARHLAETVPAGTPVAVVGGGLEASRGLVDEVPSGP